MPDRLAQLRDAAARRYDVIVIGGGINGAGIARDAAERGLAVLLLEQHDWGFGTTWRSTKLIHGGLRYLEHGEVPLVFESLRERAVLLRTAPHLVRPIPFLLPVYRGDRRGLILLRAGLTLYDLLATGGGLPRHRVLTAAAALAAEPRLRPAGLRGALGYWDGQVALPERLCLENVLRAQDAGATTLSYVRAERIETKDGAVTGVGAVDLQSGLACTFRASLVVNAAGPWVDSVLRRARLPAGRIGGTRGTHLVVRFPGGGPRRPLYAEARRDGRPFFIIPWRGVHLVGTTDVRVATPDETRPTADEVAYLIEAARRLLPGDRIDRSDVWYAFAGIRPLPRSDDAREAAITRRHHVVNHAGEGLAGLMSIVGGKLGTYRSLAAQVTDRLFDTLGRAAPACRTARAPLVPGDWRPSDDDCTARRLWGIYGARARDVLMAMRADPRLAAPLCPHTYETAAQVLHGIRREGAITVADILLRRTPAGWSRCLGMDAAPTVAGLMARELGWSRDDERAAVAAYCAEVGQTFRTFGGSP